MPSTSHRRCQYQGDTCQGVTHAGFDVCARCYFDYVKPALKAEKAEMKRRRAIKKGLPLLSPANRALISEVDLKEPQMRSETALPVLPPPPQRLSIARAVSETLIDRDIEMGEAAGKSSLQVVEDLFLKIMHDDDLPAHIAPTARRVPRIDTPKKEEPKIPVMPTLKRGRKPGLTETQKDEVLEMYKSGISTTEIQTAYSIGAQTLYSLVHNAGLPLRGAPQAKEPASVPTPPVSPPPPAAAASVNGRASDLTEWVVTYTVTRTETTIVAAKSFNDAAATITDGDVISVAKKLP